MLLPAMMNDLADQIGMSIRSTRRLLLSEHDSHELRPSMSKIKRIGDRKSSSTSRIRENGRLGPKIAETVKGTIRLGARILKARGVTKAFRQNFSVREGEELLKASQCYVWTTAGPIAGHLFISTHKVAFCSDRPIDVSSPSANHIKAFYKVLIPLRKIKMVTKSKSSSRPSTEDDFDFWFSGFLNYQKTLEHLQQAIISEAQLGLH